jgi:hypothetical protein
MNSQSKRRNQEAVVNQQLQVQINHDRDMIQIHHLADDIRDQLHEAEEGDIRDQIHEAEKGNIGDRYRETEEGYIQDQLRETKEDDIRDQLQEIEVNIIVIIGNMTIDVIADDSITKKSRNQ